MKTRTIVCPMLLAVPLVGCGAPASSNAPPAGAGGGAFGQVGAEIEKNQQQAAADQQKAAAEAARRQARAQEQAEADAAARKVTIDDMRRGKSLRGGGYLATVLSARFRAEHKLILIQVEHAMNLYNGLHGHYPKSHDEFMTNVIQANSLQLPELDEGFEYLYDPDDHQLKMRRTPVEEGTDQP